LTDFVLRILAKFMVGALLEPFSDSLRETVRKVLASTARRLREATIGDEIELFSLFLGRQHLHLRDLGPFSDSLSTHLGE
jgi:hypothetical protein